MKHYLWLLLLGVGFQLPAQTLRFKVVDTVLNLTNRTAEFGGISGIEYVPQQNIWYLLTDGRAIDNRQSYVFALKGVGRDSLVPWKNLDTLKPVILPTVHNGEAIRFDPTSGSFWLCTEEDSNGSIKQLTQYDWHVAYSPFSYSIIDNNRGYEALAITGKDTIWTIREWPFPADGQYARLTCLQCARNECRLLAEMPILLLKKPVF